MPISDIVVIAIISSIASLLGGGLVFIVAWRKSGPEMKKSLAEANAAEAAASETWAQSNQLAATQLLQMQIELKSEREKVKLLEENVVEMQKKLVAMAGRLSRLEQQVVQLGAIPVE